MKLFVYESLSAGALGDDPPASMRAEGRAMLAAIAADFAKVADVSTLLSIGEPDIPGVRCLGTSLGSEHHNFLDAIGQHDAVLIIAPECDGILAKRCQSVVKARRRLLGCTPAAVRATADKLALFRHWTKRGVPTPPTRRVTSKVPETFPVVVKPIDGAGSLATRLIADAALWRSQLDETKRELPSRFIVQPYHRGLSCSVALLVGAKQTLPLVPTQQILSDDGRFKYLGGRLPLAPELASRAIEIATKAITGIDGLAGYVGVDLILSNKGDDVAIEINPRLTTSYLGLRALCRDNLAEVWLRLVDGANDVTLSWRSEEVAFGADEA